MIKTRLLAVGLGCLLLYGIGAMAEETLPPLVDGKVPQSHAELWADFDPRAEPLDLEILKEWEEEGVVLKVLRYRIGIFKGQKAMMVAVYGYPKGGTKLPGLVQIHGGGQYADYKAPLVNGKRGYATISIGWAGRISAPDYRVGPGEVKLFWEGKTDDPAYRVTTDWGALDAYHAPSRNPGNSFLSTAPAAWTLDAVDSPRNNPWFLVTLGARRALTFLEQQPEVDPGKLGVYGHSMGGKLTVQTAGSDSRVKAAVPSCGGISDRTNDSELFVKTITDDKALKNITCPILFQSPANDFHGKINDLHGAIAEIQREDWRVTCSPHHNHQDTANYEVASQLWFDGQLKDAFAFPATPRLTVKLDGPVGIPYASVVVDDSKPVLGVEFYYTQHGQMDGGKDDMNNTKSRFWHFAKAERRRDPSPPNEWHSIFLIASVDKPLWVYANVIYSLEEPVSYAGYYYGVGSSKEVTVSSLMFVASATEVKESGVDPGLAPSLVIESFEGDWEKEWFTYRPEEWGRHTNKLYSEVWKAPEGATLAIEVRAEEANRFALRIDTFATEIALKGGTEWEGVELSPSDFENAAGETLENWDGIRNLSLSATETLRTKVDGEDKQVKFGAPWQGADPEFRNLRWLSKH